jgi:hypothetical protein
VTDPIFFSRRHIVALPNIAPSSGTETARWGLQTGASTMDHRKKVLLAAEEQLVFGRFLAEVTAARNELRQTHPDSLLLQLMNAKLRRMSKADWTRASPWAA